MKIVIAVDSFKGCCTSIQAADAFGKGVLDAVPGLDGYNLA
jgi:glycerate kinase